MGAYRIRMPAHGYDARSSILSAPPQDCSPNHRQVLVRPVGYDPATPWLKVKCSTNWATIAYKSRLTHPRELASSPIIRAAIVIVTAPKRLILCSAQFKNHLLGGPDWNRTSDTGIFSPLLYRLSYRTIFTLPFYVTTMILAGGTSPLHRTRNSRHNFEASGVRTLHLWRIVAASTFPLLSYRSI